MKSGILTLLYSVSFGYSTISIEPSWMNCPKMNVAVVSIPAPKTTTLAPKNTSG
jgi:hypothetical protein